MLYPGSGSKRAQKNNVSHASHDFRRRKITAICCVLALLLALAFYLHDPEGFTQALRIAAEGAYSEATPQPGATPFLEAAAATPMPSPSPASIPGQTEGTLEIYVLDVGQGDSIFLRSPKGKTMLVDTGEAQYFSVIDDFLQKQGVEKLDVVVATHPHSDHIGSMYKVLDAYPVRKFYLPAVTHTTSTFEKMLSSLEAQNVTPKIAYASKSAKIAWGDSSVTARILSPFEGVDYEMNNWSIVLNVHYGETSILLTGDAEAYAESVMLANLPVPEEELAATVLKLGHHGSSTSTSEAFLSAVSPEIAVVSVGKGNDYGHPNEETLALLEQHGITLYRTDEQGTIKIVLDGTRATVTVEKG